MAIAGKICPPVPPPEMITLYVEGVLIYTFSST
jgi:hypothetical protein